MAPVWSMSDGEMPDLITEKLIIISLHGQNQLLMFVAESNEEGSLVICGV